jgi:hypothetical protein
MEKPTNAALESTSPDLILQYRNWVEVEVVVVVVACIKSV